MEFRASHRYARISAKKARPAADLIRGENVNRALELLAHHPSRGASMLHKVLVSAIANARESETVDANALVVSDARVDMGPLVQGRMRWRPGPMGRAMPIRRRTSHLRISVLDVNATAPRKG
ncbi:MAG TPA: 50S ribosomal protein L22 [Planctomycetota bacterium]